MILCYKRRGVEKVPGCLGTGVEGKDYCAYRNPSNYLLYVGNNGEPSDVFPLGLCQGDCDNDGECAGGLECFQRSDQTPVPGCVGKGADRADYCYDPESL